MITDDEAMAAAKTLLEYHDQRLRRAVLDVIAEYHEDMVERLRLESEQIPARTAAERRAAEACRNRMIGASGEPPP
jgi:hypothetical protein